MRPRRVSSRQVPDSLLRFFEKEEHARRFIEGKIRFGLIDRYRNVPDGRRDESEGEAFGQWNLRSPEVVLNSTTGEIVDQRVSTRNIRWSNTSLNPHYVLSTCHPSVKLGRIAKKFGCHVVRINNPEALLARIRKAWKRRRLAFQGCAFIARVDYNKGELLEPNPNLVAPAEYTYSQKPRSYENEKEFRYVLKCIVPLPGSRRNKDHIVLKVPDCSDICCLLSRDRWHR